MLTGKRGKEARGWEVGGAEMAYSPWITYQCISGSGGRVFVMDGMG